MSSKRKESERALEAVKVHQEAAIEGFKKAKDELREATKNYSQCVQEVCSTYPPPFPRLTDSTQWELPDG